MANSSSRVHRRRRVRGTVRGRPGPRRWCRRRRAAQEAAFQADGDLADVPRPAPRAQPSSWTQRIRQARQRLLGGTASPGVDGGLPVRVDGVVEPLRLLVVRRHHPPVGLGVRRRLDQRHGGPGVQFAVPAGRCELGGHLPEQLVTESPTDRTGGFEDPRRNQFGDNTVDVGAALGRPRRRCATARRHRFAR